MALDVVTTRPADEAVASPPDTNTRKLKFEDLPAEIIIMICRYHFAKLVPGRTCRRRNVTQKREHAQEETVELAMLRVSKTLHLFAKPAFHKEAVYHIHIENFYCMVYTPDPRAFSFKHYRLQIKFLPIGSKSDFEQLACEARRLAAFLGEGNAIETLEIVMELNVSCMMWDKNSTDWKYFKGWIHRSITWTNAVLEILGHNIRQIKQATLQFTVWEKEPGRYSFVADPFSDCFGSTFSNGALNEMMSSGLPPRPHLGDFNEPFEAGR